MKNDKIRNSKTIPKSTIPAVKKSPLCKFCILRNFFGKLYMQNNSWHSILGRSKPKMANAVPSNAYLRNDMWNNQCNIGAASTIRMKKPENIINGAMKNDPNMAPF